jgi:chorismate--pyruvate lyase
MMCARLLESLAMKWQPYPQLQHRIPSPALKDWLRDRGSLTERLVDKSGGDFRVQLLGQRWGRPHLDEARSLGIAPRHRVMIREVILHGHQTPWVYARSLLPAKSLDHSLRRLKHLGTKPLGAFLFSDPGMKRSEIEIGFSEKGWGRRSVFYLQGQPLLVSEVFLPTFPLE